MRVGLWGAAAGVKAHAPQALAEYKAWLEKTVPLKPPSDKLTKALNYSLNQWDKLVRYVDNPSLNIDNNRAERAIKPFVIGRKNWLFANTANGAQSSANLYSLIETAKANGLIAYDYLVKLFEELPNGPLAISCDGPALLVRVLSQ